MHASPSALGHCLYIAVLFACVRAFVGTCRSGCTPCEGLQAGAASGANKCAVEECRTAAAHCAVGERCRIRGDGSVAPSAPPVCRDCGWDCASLRYPLPAPPGRVGQPLCLRVFSMRIWGAWLSCPAHPHSLLCACLFCPGTTGLGDGNSFLHDADDVLVSGERDGGAAPGVSQYSGGLDGAGTTSPAGAGLEDAVADALEEEMGRLHAELSTSALRIRGLSDDLEDSREALARALSNQNRLRDALEDREHQLAKSREDADDERRTVEDLRVKVGAKGGGFASIYGYAFRCLCTSTLWPCIPVACIHLQVDEVG